jgi:hypothetical protein
MISQLTFAAAPELQPSGPSRTKRKSPDGDATTDLVFTSHCGNNSEIFGKILSLFVPKGSKIADVTYGLGAFWKSVNESDYQLFPTDLKTGVDCRKLPYERGEMDAVVLDPPYMEGLLREDGSNAGNGTHSTFQTAYSNGLRPEGLDAKWHDAVLQLYVQAGKEAQRVLKPKGGVFIVKCQDEVSACIQRLTHVELVLNFWSMGFYPKDLFVVTRTGRPGVSRSLAQKHARKNHSYFLIFETGATASRMNCINLMAEGAAADALRQARPVKKRDRSDKSPSVAK